MENYKLKENEVVLYKGEITLADKKGNTQLILTNLNIVFITKNKKLFTEEEVNVDFYPVEEIKIYEGIPQIKTKGNIVELYLLSTEKEFTFISKIELHKFMSEAKKLLTGKTTAERNAEKVKNTIKLVDDTLGIDTVSAVGNTVKDGIVGKVGKGFKAIGKIFKK